MSRTRDSKGISKKLIQDVHRIINESIHLDPRQAVKRGLSPEMKLKIKKRAEEIIDRTDISHTQQEELERELTKMVIEDGNDLDDIESLVKEIKGSWFKRQRVRR